eukprot:CAMPEP_0198309408 /NCGR_PEP_ID=MMETSP1450-20131203/1809_1 /TAXON_ID=753684 ORGANISM="Madagascaria erythrocladiodes, Strain CCMP3234" /NCGR_SAMPLE_ID=MMETSP1450 /ASSEMBLY_ACC=CAM_ASM_001115 /LENGTH=255 /DNA_ID=CAMNT_0044012165 /DNA_START=197 /DNA_END=964 /DNA_ORIENTATION=+
MKLSKTWARKICKGECGRNCMRRAGKTDRVDSLALDDDFNLYWDGISAGVNVAGEVTTYSIPWVSGPQRRLILNWLKQLVEYQCSCEATERVLSVPGLSRTSTPCQWQSLRQWLQPSRAVTGLVIDESSSLVCYGTDRERRRLTLTCAGSDALFNDNRIRCCSTIGYPSPADSRECFCREETKMMRCTIEQKINQCLLSSRWSACTLWNREWSEPYFACSDWRDKQDIPQLLQDCSDSFTCDCGSPISGHTNQCF